jgi:hypothetical protein
VQLKHTEDDFTAEYVPGEQLLQTDEPGRFEKVPAEHRRHAEDLMAEYEPGEQLKHKPDVFAPSTWEPSTWEYVPREQLMHAAEEFAPSACEYVPVGQLVQTDDLIKE